MQVECSDAAVTEQRECDNLIVARLIKISPPFMETACSFPWSQEPACTNELST
jgi:hypothetical protein